MRRVRSLAGAGPSWLFKLAWTLLIVVPFVLMILLSFRSMTGIYNSPLGLSGDWQPHNYVDAWHGPPGGAGFGRYARNSAVVVVVALLVASLFGSAAAYFTATLPAVWRRRAMLVPLLATTVPAIVLLIPFFRTFNAIGMLNDPAALGVLYGLLCLPTTILVLHAFFVDFPTDVREAAALDGLGPLGTFARIVLPLSGGPLVAISLLNMIWVWGETQIGIVLLQSSDSQTIPVGLLTFQGRFISNLGPLFAGLTMATIPVAIAYLVFHRSVSRGISLGGFR